MGVIHISIADTIEYSTFDFGPRSDICQNELALNEDSCKKFKTLFGGNIILLVSLVISFFFNLAAVWNVAITIRNRSKDLTSLYSGFAAFFSFAGIATWFIFALIAV